MENVGLKVKELRESRGWSQDELARRSGIRRSSISTYEQGERVPSAGVVYAFAKAFNVTSDFLLGLSTHRTVELDGLTEQEEQVVRDMIEVLRNRK